MTGVATHDDDHSGRGLCKKDFEGEMLGPDFAGAGKGSVVLDALEKGSENPPKDATRPILWKVLVRLYELLPDGAGTVRRNSVSSSESNVSVSFEDLQDSFAKLKEDLLTSLPNLVAPKVSEILAPKEEVTDGRK